MGNAEKHIFELTKEQFDNLVSDRTRRSKWILLKERHEAKAMIETIDLSFRKSGHPSDVGEFIVVLRGEIFRAVWTSTCWTAKGKPNFIAPDWWAEIPDGLNNGGNDQ